MVRTYCHEAGHFIDRNLAQNGFKYFSDDSAWTKAMLDDKMKSGRVSVTTYGANANTEDFAESVAEFIRDTVTFKKDFPNRAKLIQKILNKP